MSSLPTIGLHCSIHFTFVYSLLAGLPGFARDSKLLLFSADMIFPTMLAPHRITNPGVSLNGNTGILTQLADTRKLFMLWPPGRHINPPKSPLGYRGANCFSLCPFPGESAGVYQMLCQLVHPFGSYSRFLNF